MSYFEPEDCFRLDGNFDFNAGVNKLLDQEVKNRLSQMVKDYDAAIEDAKKSKEKLAQLESELDGLKKKLSNAESIFRKEGKDEALREMLRGYKLEDEVWFVKNTYTREECSVCLGDKQVIAEIKNEEMKIKCPSCNGNGTKGKAIRSIEKGKITEIKMHTWARGQKFEMKIYIDPTSYRAPDSVESRFGLFFKTKEDCQKSLDKIMNQ